MKTKDKIEYWARFALLLLLAGFISMFIFPYELFSVSLLLSGVVLMTIVGDWSKRHNRRIDSENTEK